MMKLAITPLAILLLGTACLRGTTYICKEDSQCGAGNTCEPNGYCSFPDTDCQRYTDSAGSLAGECVNSVMADAGVDTNNTIDADIDAPTTGCPNGYNPLPGLSTTHLYRLVTDTAQWSMQRSFCTATTTSAYLAIPDDEAEMMALSTLAADEYWVGISDSATEGQYVNVKNMAQVFLPWSPPNEPNQAPGDGDCVMSNATAKIYDDRCNTQYRAICECEP